MQRVFDNVRCRGENAVNTCDCTATVANQHGEFTASTHGVEQRRSENGKMKCFYYYNYYYYNQMQHSKPLR